MKKDRIYIATMAKDAGQVIKDTGLGIELDHYCWADFMYGEKGESTRRRVERDYGFLMEKGRFTVPVNFHAPFNELHPAAIDSGIRDIANKRFEDAFDLAESYGIGRMIVHSGYVPFVYMKKWHVDRSKEFWERLMRTRPYMTIYIENVLEDEPYLMKEVIDNIEAPNVKLCFDVGHCLCMSRLDPVEWIRVLGDSIGHVHLHNNDGKGDLHRSPDMGSGNCEKVMDALSGYCPEATLTLECKEAASAVRWMEEKGYIG